MPAIRRDLSWMPKHALTANSSLLTHRAGSETSLNSDTVISEDYGCVSARRTRSTAERREGLTCVACFAYTFSPTGLGRVSWSKMSMETPLLDRRLVMMESLSWQIGEIWFEKR